MVTTAARPFPARPARGLVTAVAVMFLIATVVFALGAMLVNSGGAVVDGQRQADSTAAFFLAESGLDKMQSTLGGSLGSSYTEATCNGLSTTYALGRGSVTIEPGVSTPSPCTLGGTPNCEKCAITSTGTVGTAVRTLSQELTLTSRDGTFCNAAVKNCSNTPVTWQLKLTNPTAYNGVGIFNLGYIEQGNTTATCAGASNCRLQVDLTSPSAGANAVGHMTNAVLIPAGTTYPIYQTLNRGDRSVVEVGTFFFGTAAAPTLTGPNANPGAAAYWNARNADKDARTMGTMGGATPETTGATNNGTASAVTACAAPSTSNTSQQTCDSWCHGGDTLVFNVAAQVAGLTAADEITGVTFGTNATVGQNIAMTKAIKYPTASVASPPTTIDTEIWYARNPNFAGTSPDATGVSSYKGYGNTSTSASIGAFWQSSNAAGATNITGNTLTVGTDFTGTDQVVSVGDSVAVTNNSGTSLCPLGGCGVVTGQLTPTGSEVLGGRGRYTLSVTLTSSITGNNRRYTVSSNVLRVKACTVCYFASGDALNGLVTGRNISGAQITPATYGGITEVADGVGRYPISGTPTYVAAGTIKAGTPGTTLYLPTASAGQPAVTTPIATRIVKKEGAGTGTGAIAPNTTVTATATVNAATNSFTVSAAPTTPLEGATICGGTCAMFVQTAGTKTSFSLQGMTAARFSAWVGGFVCLKGVDVAPTVVKSFTATTGRWTEVVQ